MDQNVQFIWREMYADMFTSVGLSQLVAIAIACIAAWLVKSVLRDHAMRSATEKWKLGIGGINRSLFPLLTLVFIQLAKLMPEYWQHNSLLRFASILLLAMVVIRLIVYTLRYIFGGLLKTLENSVSTLIWAVFALHVSGFLSPLLQLLENVKFDIGRTPFNLWLVLQAIFIVIVTIFLALWISRMIENRLMHAEHVNMNLRVVMSKLLRVILLFLAVLIALSAVGLDITLLSVFGGALGVGLGFGLQRIASNYVSGFIILLDKSMQIGDVVTVESHYGVVSDLRTRYLILRKLDGTEVIIPNETLIINPVINHSFSDHRARVQMEVQVSYDSQLELAMQLILDIAKQHSRILQEPAPAVYIKSFGESGIDLTLTTWIPDPEEGSAALQSEIYLEIWRVFKKNGISIPFPQREIRMLTR